MDDIEAKLARLTELETKLATTKRKNTDRVKAYLSRKRQEGMVTVSALISRSAYEIINNERDKSVKAGLTPETAGSVIERALILLSGNTQSVKDNININDNINTFKAEEKPEPKAKDPTDRKNSERLKEIMRMSGEGMKSKEIAKQLNESGQLTPQGRLWTDSYIRVLISKQPKTT